MRNTDNHISAWLSACRELSALTRENGWVDDESLCWEIKRTACDFIDVAVSFEEVVVKPAGCEGERVPCFGYLRLWLDGEGEIVRAEVHE